VVALGFWFGSFFAEQIRHRQSYPFLEVIGIAGSGKSTLISFLWKLVGRFDYEGFDATNANTVAVGRNLAQVSNLPVVLLEGGRTQPNNAQGRPAKGFNFEELKKCYNGNAFRSRGVRNQGNETCEPPFRASPWAGGCGSGRATGSSRWAPGPPVSTSAPQEARTASSESRPKTSPRCSPWQGGVMYVNPVTKLTRNLRPDLEGLSENKLKALVVRMRTRQRVGMGRFGGEQWKSRKTP